MLKLLSFAHCVFRAIAKAIYDDGFDNFKASTTLGILQIMLLFLLSAVPSLIIGRNLLKASGISPLLLVAGVTGTVIYIEEKCLFRTEAWAKYEREFRHHGKRTRLLGGVAVLVVAGFIVWATFVVGGLVAKLPL